MRYSVCHTVDDLLRKGMNVLAPPFFPSRLIPHFHGFIGSRCRIDFRYWNFGTFTQSHREWKHRPGISIHRSKFQCRRGSTIRVHWQGYPWGFGRSCSRRSGHGSIDSVKIARSRRRDKAFTQSLQRPQVCHRFQFVLILRPNMISSVAENLNYTATWNSAHLQTKVCQR